MATVKIPIGTNDINQFIKGYPPGTVFQFQAGIHRVHDITPRQGDLFTGVIKDGIRMSTLSGAKILSDWIFTGSYWWIGNQTQQGENPSPDVCEPDSPACTLPEDLFIDNELVKRVLSLEEVRPGTWFFDYDTNKIYIGDNPNGRLVETSVYPSVFSNGNSASGVTIEKLIIEKYAAPTAKAAVNLGHSPLGGINWMISKCEVRFCHGAGIGTDSFSSALENYVHHNGGFGFIGAGEGISVLGNEICYNNTCGYNPYWGAGGSKWVYTTNMKVIGNYSHHNNGIGLWTDINNIGTLYESNVCEWNMMDGIFHEISYAAVIKKNICKFNGRNRLYPYWTSGAGIAVANSPDVEVYENTVEENWQGITGLNVARGEGTHGPWELRNMNVHNNRIISTIQPDGSGRTGITGNPFVNCKFENNHYTLAEGKDLFFWEDKNMKEAGWKSKGNDLNGTFKYV